MANQPVKKPIPEKRQSPSPEKPPAKPRRSTSTMWLLLVLALVLLFLWFSGDRENRSEISYGLFRRELGRRCRGRRVGTGFRA